jgi:hypothetical protein
MRLQLMGDAVSRIATEDKKYLLSAYLVFRPYRN